MKSPLLKLLAVVLVLLMWCGAAPAAEGGKGQDPAKVAAYAQKVMDVLTVENIGALMDMPIKFYFAGASFQKSLLAPLDRVEEYESGESRRLMSSIYYLDAVYAQLCRKKKIAAKYFTAWNEMTQEFIIQLCPELKSDFYQGTQTVLKEYRDAPPEKIRDVLAYLVVQGNKKLVESSLGIEVVVDGFYSAFIEMLYLSTNMVIPMDPTSKFLENFGEQARKQAALGYDLLTHMAADPEYAKLCNVPERQKLIRAVTDALAPATLSVDDVKKIHALVAPVRKAMVAMN